MGYELVRFEGAEMCAVTEVSVERRARKRCMQVQCHAGAAACAVACLEKAIPHHNLLTRII